MSDFEEIARSTRHKGTMSELWNFLRQSRKWWLLPIIVVLVAFGILIFLSSTAAAPFIYTLF